MKILFVSPVPTDKGGAGNRARIATLVQSVVACGHEVHFAYIPMEDADLTAMAERFGTGRLHLLKYPQPTESFAEKWLRKAGRFLKVDRAFMRGLDEWFDDGLTPQLQALQAQHKFEAVCVEYVFMSKALESFPPDVLKLLDTHDCFGMRHRRYLEAGKKPQWFSTSNDDEVRGFQRANAVIAIQESEASVFRQRLGAGSRTSVIEVGHLLEAVNAVRPSTEPKAIFVGSDNPINVSAAHWFMSRVYPLVQQAIPSFELLLAGSVSKFAAPQPGLRALGFVQNLGNAFSQAAVAVNPVLMGTGLNIKLLDAMAYGMPCLTTATGARGLDQFRDSALWVVADDDAQGFAQRLIQLLTDRPLLEAQAKAARSAADQWNLAQQSNLMRLLGTDASSPH